MSTITLRGLKPDAANKVRQRANREGKSMNRCLLDLVEASIIGKTDGKPREYNDLDRFFGSMTEEDANHIETAIADSRSIDEELWS